MTEQDDKAEAATGSKLFQLATTAWARCLALALFGIGVHLPAIRGQLLWDDIALVRDNPLIKSPILIWEAFRHYLFPDAHAGHYRPVQTISYIVDYALWNKNPFGYHLSNIVWHVLSGILLYFLLCRILKALLERWPRAGFTALSPANLAFVLALCWMVHPVHSAAVDYVSGRADSLAFVFACGAWLLYFRGRDLPSSWRRRGLFGLAAVCALFALCSRESGMLWMLLFLFYVLALEKPARLRVKVCVVAVCLGVALLYAGLRQLPEHRPVNVPAAGWTPAMRSLLMVRALGDYGRLMIFPSQLHIERSVWEPALQRTQPSLVSAFALHGVTVAGVLLLTALLFGMIRSRSGQRLRIFGAVWFLLTYLPISNLFDLNATVAEHWLYLPSVGICIFLAGCLVELPTRWLRPAAAFACVAVAGLSVRSAVRSSDWQDPETFFRRTFAAGGASSRIGVNLAVIYATGGEHAKAEAILRKVLEAFPEYPLARNNLALALSAQGKTEEAQALLESAAKSAAPEKGGHRPTSDAARNLARLRHKEKEDIAALEILDTALRDYPGDWDLVRLQAEIVRANKGPAGALLIVQHFVRDHWWHAGASITLGGLFLEMGDLSRAAEAFRQASALDVYDTEALNLLALISVRQNDFTEAWRIQRSAIARQPDEPRQYLILADILEKLGRHEEARAAQARAELLDAVAKSAARKVAAK
jgi:Flp pilus assembly protein TadD